MYWLVENKEQLEVLSNSGFKEAFIEVIPYNDNIHPTKSHISLMYIRPLEATKGFMLCIHHSEALNELSTYKTGIVNMLKGFKRLYCYDKKELLHYIPLKSLYDINTPPTTYIRPTTKTHEIFYSNHGEHPKLNLIIPIVKHYEKCETLFRDLKTNITKEKTKYDEFFNNKVSLVFNAIERNGLRVHNETFTKYFHPLLGNTTYTQFNLKTLTTRPSNSFKNVNYAALNKKNGCRQSFIPRNNRLVEIDISAYHPNLTAMLINYIFPTNDIHSYFATLYNVDYKKSKELTFKQLYGGVFEAYKDLEFYKRVEKYIKELWFKFENDGFVECPISHFVYTKERLEDMNPQKLFNYLLQSTETSMNVLIVWDILKLLRGKKTKLIHYCYDSFLFDVDRDEEEILDTIRGVFKIFKLNIKEVSGKNYGEMV